MKNRRTILSLSIPLGIIFLFQGAIAWGGLGACNGTYTLPSSGLWIDGNSSTPTAGCEQVDLNFGNFTYGLLPSGGPTVDYVGAVFSGASAPGAITSTFGSSTTNYWTGLGGAVLGSVQSNTVSVDSSQSNGSTITQAVLSIGAATMGSASGTSTFILAVEEFCTGSSTLNCTSSSSNFGILEYVLTLDGSNNPITYSGSCYGGGAVCQQLSANQVNANGSGISLTDLTSGTSHLTLDIPSTTVLTVENIVALNTAVNSNLYSLANEWDEATPEPSTFTLLGTALTGLGAFAWKRRTHAFDLTRKNSPNRRKAIMQSTRSSASQGVGHRMRRLLTLAVIFIAGGVLLSPVAFASMSYSETFDVEALFGSANQTFTTSPFAPFDQAGTLVGIGIAISGNVTLENALVGEELEITIPGIGINNEYVNESETAGLWSFSVSASGIDTSPSDLSFYGGLTSPIEIEVQLIDANTGDQLEPPSSISGTWTWYYTPEPGSMLPVAMGLTGLALAGLRTRRMRGR